MQIIPDFCYDFIAELLLEDEELETDSRIRDIQSEIRKTQGEKAWGQYATDEIPVEAQEGLAGTSGAIQILAITPNSKNMELIEEGQEYLFEELNNWEQSNKNVVYKYAALLNGLAATEQITESKNGWTAVDDLCEGRAGDTWDDYLYGESGRPYIGTCVALHSLSNSALHSVLSSEALGSNSFDNIVDKLKSDIDTNNISLGRNHFTERHIVEAAYCLLILSRLDEYKTENCNDYDGRYSDDMSKVAETVSNLVEKVEFDRDPYYIRIYYVPIADEKPNEADKSPTDVDFRYQPFLVDAIAAVALIKSGHITKNTAFIKSVVGEYLNQTGEKQLFTPNREEHPPISDNLWVAKLFDSYDDININESIDSREFVKIRLSDPVREGGTVGVALILLILAIYIQSLPPDLEIYGFNLSILQPASFIIAGYLLNKVISPRLGSLRKVFSNIFNKISGLIDK
jgi:hypothetical protein